MVPLGSPGSQNDSFVGFGGCSSSDGLSGQHSGGQWRAALCSEHTESFACFLGILFGFDFRGEIFISNKGRTKKDKEAAGCFCLFCFPLPSSEIECLALRGDAEGEGFFFSSFPGISLVLYFFGAQKPCGVIMGEFTRSSSAKGPEQNRCEHTTGIVRGGDAERLGDSFQGDPGDSMAVAWGPFEKHLLW